MMLMDEMVVLPEVDQVMVALMGAVGLYPTLEALRAGKQVALSNKEPIVMAGPGAQVRRSQARRRHSAGGQRTQRHLAVPPG